MVHKEFFVWHCFFDWLCFWDDFPLLFSISLLQASWTSLLFSLQNPMQSACVHSFMCLKCDERHLVIVDQQFLKFVQLALRTVRAPVEGTFDVKQPWNQWWITLSCAHFAVDSGHRLPGRFMGVGFNFKLRNFSLEFSS